MTNNQLQSSFSNSSNSSMSLSPDSSSSSIGNRNLGAIVQSNGQSNNPTMNASKVQEQVESFKKFNQHNMIHLTRHLHRQVTVNMNKRLEACGYKDVATRHLSVFDHLDFDGTNIVTLANRANITKQAMGKLVREVSTAGYVMTQPDKSDSRSVIVKFSDKGLHFLHNVQKETNKAREVVLKSAAVSHDEVMTTIETLTRILGFFDNTPSLQNELFLN